VERRHFLVGVLMAHLPSSAAGRAALSLAIGAAGQRMRVNAGATAGEWAEPDVVCSVAELATTYAPSAVLRGVIAYTTDAGVTYVCRRTGASTYAWALLAAGATAAAAQAVILPTALPGTALHLHRLNEASGTLADQGSGATAAVISGSSAVRATPGPYRWGGGIELVAPASTDRITVATSVPVGDCSIAVTILAPAGSAPSAPSNAIIYALWDQGTLGAENTLALLLHSTGYLYSYCWGSGTGTPGTAYTPSWAGALRCVVTYQHGAGATKTTRLYVNGVLRQTNVATNALLATKTQATALGIAGDIYSTGALAGLVISDTQVWGSQLTQAQITADYRQVRGAMLL
jgi:hypothetical protein